MLERVPEAVFDAVSRVARFVPPNSFIARIYRTNRA